MEVYFCVGYEAHYAKKLTNASGKTFFFEIPRIFALRPFLSPDRDYKLFICGAEVVQKCEEFQKKSFSRGISQLFRVVRFVTYTKVNFHEKT